MEKERERQCSAVDPICDRPDPQAQLLVEVAARYHYALIPIPLIIAGYASMAWIRMWMEMRNNYCNNALKEDYISHGVKEPGTACRRNA